MPAPWRSLGIYKPKLWKAWVVGRDLLRITREAGYTALCDPKHRHQTKAAWCSVKDCAYVRRRTVRGPKAAAWHQDGDLTGEEMDMSMVLWSSNTPTEIKDADGKIWIPHPYEVVVVPNLSVYHRRPPNAPRVRWLFRQIVRNKNTNERTKNTSLSN